MKAKFDCGHSRLLLVEGNNCPECAAYFTGDYCGKQKGWQLQ